MFMAIEQMQAVWAYLCSGAAVNGVCFALVALAVYLLAADADEETQERERRERDGG